MTIPNCMLVLNQDPRSESQMKLCRPTGSHVCLLAVPAQSACEIVYTVRAP